MIQKIKASYKGPLSTILGILILLASFALAYKGLATLTEVILIAGPFALYLIFSKDTIFQNILKKRQ